MSILHILSTVVLILIGIGIWKRKTPKAHYPFMLAAFALDIGMVLYIELTRQAVDTVMTDAGPLLWFHVAASVTVIIAYLVQFELGRRLLVGAKASRTAHVWVGVSFCCLRLVNYVTSFFIS